MRSGENNWVVRDDEMITIKTSGDFGKTSRYLKEMAHKRFLKKIAAQAAIGTEALRQNTPKDSGLTAESWYAEIEETDTSVTVYWKNSNIHNNFPVAIGLQFGHGTGTGGYVQGRDYINPSLEHTFEQIREAIREEVKA